MRDNGNDFGFVGKGLQTLAYRSRRARAEKLPSITEVLWPAWANPSINRMSVTRRRPVLCANLFALFFNEAHAPMNPTNPADAATPPSKPIVTSADRRRRKRAKITAQVHVRGGLAAR